MSNLFAGLDVSTQSCKLVIIDIKSQSVAYVDTVNYDTDLTHYKTRGGVVPDLGEGISECDPQMWLEAVELVFERLKGAPIAQDQILGISVSAQQHGLVALDVHGNLTRTRSKLWNDYSTLEECRLLTEKVGGKQAMIEEVGNTQRAGYTAGKIFHLQRHEPDAFQRSSTLFLVHNFVNWHLTGGKNGGIRVMEPGDCSGMALWNPKTQTWSQKVIDAIDSRLVDKLPPIKLACESIGIISKQLAEKYGFSPECMLDAGCGDNMYAAVGTGNVKPGVVTISLGTSGTAYCVLPEPFVDPEGEIAAFCDSTGNFLPLLCVSNLSNGYDQLLRKYDLTHDQFSQIIHTTRPGNAGMLLLPWYLGERTPDLPLATSVFFGFGLEDFTKASLSRAVLEGPVLNLFDGFQRLPVKPAEIRLTGGLSKSDGWCQTIADVFEASAVPVEGEGAALGAALHAAWVWLRENGEDISIDDVVAPFVVMDEKRRKQPISKNVIVHRIQKRLFHALSRRIRGLEGEDPFQLRNELLQIAIPSKQPLVT